MIAAGYSKNKFLEGEINLLTFDDAEVVPSSLVDVDMANKYFEYQGGTEAVEFGGIRRLQDFPRCASINKLSEHLDDWLDVLTTYGHELEHCPRMLRNIVMSIIPVDLEDEIVEKSFDMLTQTYKQ